MAKQVMAGHIASKVEEIFRHAGQPLPGPLVPSSERSSRACELNTRSFSRCRVKAIRPGQWPA
jgi:hypothetical protein